MSPWTEETVARLKARYAEGWSATQIAMEIGGGVSRNSVLGKLHRLGLLGTRRQLSGAAREKHAAAVRAGIRAASDTRQRNPARHPKVETRPAAGPAVPEASAEDRAPLRGSAWEALPGTVPVTLEALARGQCKWPVNWPSPSGEERQPVDGGGEPGAPAFGFCGCPAVEGSAYCGIHKARSVAGVPAAPAPVAPARRVVSSSPRSGASANRFGAPSKADRQFTGAV